MKKIILVGMLIMSMVGCSGFIPREDIYEKAEFKSEKIVKGRNKIILHEVKYPKNYFEKLEFLREFEEAGRRLLLEDKGLNLMLSQELFDDLESLKNGEFLDDERVYLKIASDLDEVEKTEVDRKAGVQVTDRGGDIQRYLNKQVYFWMSVAGKEDEFQGDKLYTELDKQRLIEEVREERKEFSQILDAMRIDSVVKVEEPYTHQRKEDGYWASKKIETFNLAGISTELLSVEVPLYLEGVEGNDIEVVVDNREDFKTPVLILENKRLKGYTIRDGRYVFYHGGEVMRGSYREFDFIIEIINSTSSDLADAEEGILFSDLLEEDQGKVQNIEGKSKKEKSLDWGLE